MVGLPERRVGAALDGVAAPARAVMKSGGRPPVRAAATIAALIAVCLEAIAGAQPAVFRSGIDAVRVDVSVMNGATAVPNLTRANFELTDNGVAQAIDDVSVDTVPLDLTMVLDTS